MASQKADYEKKLLKSKGTYQEQYQIKLEQELINHTKVHDQEKQELLMELNALKDESVDLQLCKSQYSMKQFFTKWVYISKIHALRNEKATELLEKEKKPDLAEELRRFMEKTMAIEKQFFQREMKYLEQHSGPQIMRLKEENTYLRDENTVL